MLSLGAGLALDSFGPIDLINDSDNIKLSGSVWALTRLRRSSIRRGINEKWIPACAGMTVVGYCQDFVPLE
jgi:hypothetical protein